MARTDDFEGLARYYDPIMNHVDYDRWFVTTSALAEFAPEEFLHMDAGCGTGVLMGMLRKSGWHSFGADLSVSMLRTARKRRKDLPVAAGDLRALPFRRSVHLLTCLFDSMNFLLADEDVEQALCSMSSTLTEDGILYFDVVTERMVMDHFEGRQWEEDNSGFVTQWRSTYDRKSSISETRIRVNTADAAIIRERIYPLSFLEEAVHKAGLGLLGILDADTWGRPTRRTTRVDLIAKRAITAEDERQFKQIRNHVKRCLY